MENMRLLFERAFQLFLPNERNNITNQVHERNLCGRLAIRLEAVAFEFELKGYYADTEYNRNLNGKVKTILDGEMEVVAITCDLILHSRGECIPRDNLIAVEMKKNSRPPATKDADRKRLRALTKSSYDDVWSNDGIALPEHVCGYDIGIYAELDVRNQRFMVEEYREGNLFESRYFSF